MSKNGDLINAVTSNAVNDVKRLLHAGADPNCKDVGGRPLITIAAEKNYDAVMVALVNSKKVKINQAYGGMTALYYACQEGHESIVDTLLLKKPDIELANINNHATPLIIACEKGHISIAKKLIHAGANKETAMINGSTPLLVALRCQHYAIAELLLNAGAIVDAADQAKYSALHIACLLKNQDLVALVLQWNPMIDVQNQEGLNPLHIACRSGCAAIVMMLLDKDKALVNSKTSIGDSPLTLAYEGEHFSIVGLLVNSDADLNQSNAKKQTLLMLAIIKDDLKMFGYLLSKNVDINCVDDQGNTALSLACQYQRFKMISILLFHEAQVNILTNVKDGFSPLLIMGMHENSEVVKELFAYGAETKLLPKRKVAEVNKAVKFIQKTLMPYLKKRDERDLLLSNFKEKHHNLSQEIMSENVKHFDQLELPKISPKESFSVDQVSEESVDEGQVTKQLAVIEETDKDKEEGLSELHCAAKYQRLNNIDKLIQEGEAIDQEDKLSRTPLELAIKYGLLSVVNKLLDCGAELNRLNKKGWPPFYQALLNDRDDIAMMLYRRGAILNCVTKTSKPLILIAAENDHDQVLTWLANHGESIDQKYGSDEESLLYVAAKLGSEKVVRALVELGVDVNQGNKNNSSPISIAAMNGYETIVNCLATTEAIINRANNFGWTSLMLGAKSGNVGVVKTLLDHGAENNQSNSIANGKTPLLMAIEGKHHLVVEVLVNAGEDINLGNKSGLKPIDVAIEVQDFILIQYLYHHGASLERKTKLGKAAKFFKQVISSKEISDFMKFPPKRRSNITMLELMEPKSSRVTVTKSDNPQKIPSFPKFLTSPPSPVTTLEPPPVPPKRPPRPSSKPAVKQVPPLPNKVVQADHVDNMKSDNSPPDYLLNTESLTTVRECDIDFIRRNMR